MIRRSSKQDAARSAAPPVRSSGFSSSNSGNSKRGGKINASHALYFLVGCVLCCVMLLIGIILHKANTQAGRRMNGRRTSEEATAAMLSHSSKFVDEEKKLKRELKKLVAYQEKGQCLSVPVLTRWMGDEKPVWTCAEIGMSNLGPLSKDQNPDGKQQQQQRKAVQVKEDGSTKSAVNASSQGRREALLLGDTCPPPTDVIENGGQVLMKPSFGAHRSNVDAVFAFAQGYSLKQYIGFVESLEKTGFDGDIVLSISSSPEKDVEEYLHSKSNVVVYSVDWKCYKKSGDPTDEPTAESDCNILGFYGNMDGQPVDDPRSPRPLATVRFELYWAWSLLYSPKSMLLLIDFRDTYFQLHPFTGIERSSPNSESGVLYVFEENSIVPIGKSEYNAQWIRQAYGEKVLDALKDKTVICSGSTMGEQVAIRPYLQCMVQQFDTTKCKRKGCDQGFHNYILYQQVIKNNVVFVPQGHGAVNNLSVLRTQLLSEQGLFDKEKQVVLNWDKKVSPIVHQYDRDAELNAAMRQKLSTMVNEWKDKNNKAAASI